VMATGKLHRKGCSPRLVAYLGVIGNVTWWSPLSWVRFLNYRIDRIVCVAEGVRQYLLNDVRLMGLKLDPKKVVTIYKGHKLEWYREKPADLGQFGIPEDAMVVTVASRLRPRKGLAELVRALGMINPAKNIHILMLGHEGNDEIRKAMSTLAHPERVHFGGYRSDAPNIMAASDVCCLPVLWGEGLSRMVIEGMAYGVAPLVTAVSGNTELVIDGESGVVVAPGDEPALAKAMEWLYDHPEERRRMGQAARERIGTRFRSEDTVRNTLALYREIMEE
jgi:glycosyltransferase involved in cell wall biosynthesis